MKLLAYLLTYPIIWILSILPFKVLYLISDLLYFLLYRVVGYRKKVVRSNLELVFPEKSTEEIKQIEKKFYAHLCDLFMEATKSRAITEAELNQRYELLNMEVLNQIELERSTFALFSHYANWEWSVTLNSYIKTNGFGVYQKLANPYFDKFIRRTRARWNLTLIEQQNASKFIQANEEQGIRGVYGLISDQSPMVKKARLWLPFMGITVPVFTGAEGLAKKFDLAVVFAKASKKKRGHYSLEFIPITNSASQTDPEYITRKFVELCEEQIKESPEFYLWTHRRWKHRDKVPEEFKQG
ncbi:MAG: lipid A biosynthesis acyltransferase [Eudoraea sp.]|nr:lipid A biosynthesis acyltransferase [Eudoraea sp.]